MDIKEFMEKYSGLMAAAAFADACGPIAEIEIPEDLKVKSATAQAADQTSSPPQPSEI